MDDKSGTSEWILRAMIAMATADGKLDAREIAVIQRSYQELSARTLSTEDITKAAGVNPSGQDILAELKHASPSLSTPTKEEIIRGVYLVLLADEQIAGEERKRLKDIAGALDISEIHMGAILEELAVRLAGQNACRPLVCGPLVYFSLESGFRRYDEFSMLAS